MLSWCAHCLLCHPFCLASCHIWCCSCHSHSSNFPWHCLIWPAHPSGLLVTYFDVVHSFQHHTCCPCVWGYLGCCGYLLHCCHTSNCTQHPWTWPGHSLHPIFLYLKVLHLFHQCNHSYSSRDPPLCKETCLVGLYCVLTHPGCLESFCVSPSHPWLVLWFFSLTILFSWLFTLTVFLLGEVVSIS